MAPTLGVLLLTTAVVLAVYEPWGHARVAFHGQWLAGAAGLTGR
jgi:hypothetical protein